MIVLGAVLAVLAVDPRGDFPLSDDWSYAHTARTLCETGRIEFLPWTGASVLFQAAYGAVLCTLVGFSFTVLRLSTIVLAIVGALSFGRLLTALDVGPKRTRLAVAAFALNPLYFSQSFTFMTDVPFTAFALAAAAAYAHVLKGKESEPGQRSPYVSLLGASVLASAAILIRQHGAFVVAAAAFATLFMHHATWRKRAALFTTASVVPAIVFVAFHYWLFTAQGAPAGLQNKVSETSVALGLATFDHAFRAAVTLAFAALPIVALSDGRLLGRHRRAFITFATVLGIGAVLAYVNDGSAMFYLPNVQFDFGLGAQTLRDTLFLGLDPRVTLGATLALPLTLTSLLAAAAYGAYVWRLPHTIETPVQAFVVFTAVGMFLGSLLHGGFYFDRYLIPVLPFAIAAFLVALPRADTLPSRALAAVVVLSIYALAGTHDYMSLNRTRFDLIASLEQRGIGADRIDGGFEYNAWHSAATSGTWPTKESARRGQDTTAKSWWWVTDDEYIVATSRLDGYAVAQTHTYSTWLTRGPGEVLLLERE